MRRIILALVLCSLAVLSMTQPAYAYDNDTHYVLTYYLARKAGYSPAQALQIASADISVDTSATTEPLQGASFSDPAQNVRVRYHAFLDHRLYSNQLSWWESIKATGAVAVPGLGYYYIQHAVNGCYNNRNSNLQDSWSRGLAYGNIGQYLHFMQDSYAHDGYFSKLGHAAPFVNYYGDGSSRPGGHITDFLSTDPNKAHTMVTNTLSALLAFKPYVPDANHQLNRNINTLNDIDWNEVNSVLAQLVNANPSPSFVDLFSSPDWNKARQIVSGVLHENIPDWTNYAYNADGSPQSASFRLN